MVMGMSIFPDRLMLYILRKNAVQLPYQYIQWKNKLRNKKETLENLMSPLGTRLL